MSTVDISSVNLISYEFRLVIDGLVLLADETPDPVERESAIRLINRLSEIMFMEGFDEG